jgi:hypothetical protein
MLMAILSAQNTFAVQGVDDVKAIRFAQLEGLSKEGHVSG